MTRYKNIVGKIARGLAMLPHALAGDPRNELTQDEREYRQDRRSGASNGELARDKAEIRESLDDLRDSRREVEKDRRELNRDLSEYDWRYGDRDGDNRRWWDRDSWSWR